MKERQVVRAVVLDVRGRVLLLHSRDLSRPHIGTWWELPGGGLDPGESHQDAIIRELAEEAGLTVTAAQVGAPTWRRNSTFLYRGERRLNHEVVVPVRLAVDAPDVDGAGQVDFEAEDYFGFRWWPVGEVVASAEVFYPGPLPRLLVPFLDGEPIDEPFERWS
ncbi:NUDIX hydrolase [Actinoplanes sp. TBRC 11911]|uniref:NUDIX hydrolase n=1 Tax=Actinoplanes sp. TBRC 11911 TaxID=2729386 RepID=UPI0020070A1D|nr:NUDIX domain-containing protein [Actinoplanes sp. TBRC 11911]